MPRRQQATARQERLGAELRKLREAAGLRGREAAELLGTDAARISQIESGLAGVSEARVRRIAAHYDCTDQELIDALADMAGDRTRGWWEEYRGLLPSSFLDLSELEYHATFLRVVEFLFVPGLLQTENYARAAFSSRIPELPPEEVERRVQHRMRRKATLSGPAHTSYEAVVHEAALRIRVGDRVTSRAQLARLLEVTETENVTVRVIPFDMDGFGGTWSAMMLAGGAVPRLDTVIRDAPHGTGFADSEAQLGVFRELFHRVEGASLDSDRSRDFIHRLIKEE
ncbi:helix-turn-helix transcriptional regulator [Streptomyces sp. NPDC006743]|uniref:helix-turn-helix domain-containing protein n=1 Tax=Streptomyces sp. NPDC006743 TaxID=3154480 RepID=UPI00345332A7